MKIRTTAAALVFLFTLASAGVAQQVVDVGRGIRGPQVAVAGTGDVMVVWSDTEGLFTPTGNGEGVFARLYDASGSPKGHPIVVPSNRIGNQSQPQVAADALGRFIVVWQSEDNFGGTGAGGDGDGAGVFGQRFNRDGVRLGPVFRLSDSAAGDQRTPNVAMATNGSFVAVWQDCTGTQRRCSELHAARFTASGERRGEELEIPVLTATSYIDGKPVPNPTPHVAFEPGGFAIGWTEQEACYKFQFEKFPVVLHFTSSGQPAGERYRLDDGDCEDATGWSVAALTASRTGTSAAFFNGVRNSFQLFAPDGGAVGPRRVVNKLDACGGQFLRTHCESIGDAAMESGGDFAVVWNHLTFGTSTTPSRESLQVQLFNESGRPMGGRIEVASSLNTFGLPAVAFAKDGDLIVVWADEYLQNGSHRTLRLRKIPHR